MRTLITGATGFAGQWLTRELEGAGHDVVCTPSSVELDIADVQAVRDFVAAHRPDAIAHLAAVSSSAQAMKDPGRAVRVNVGGTLAVTEAAGALDSPPAILMVSSADVYQTPRTDDPPLTELARIGPRHTYGLLKLAQEAIALGAGARYRLPIAIVRPFNHIGPGQRPGSAIISFAQRIAAIRNGAPRTLAVGNLDVERDIGDVRDHVVSYRLVLEALAERRLGSMGPITLNVATGTPISLRSVVARLCEMAGVDPEITVLPELVRDDDPPRVVGDAGALRAATGWAPHISIDTTLTDILDEQLSSAGRRAG